MLVLVLPAPSAGCSTQCEADPGPIALTLRTTVGSVERISSGGGWLCSDPCDASSTYPCLRLAEIHHQSHRYRGRSVTVISFRDKLSCRILAPFDFDIYYSQSGALDRSG